MNEATDGITTVQDIRGSKNHCAGPYGGAVSMALSTVLIFFTIPNEYTVIV